jgi:hypothetical protein
MPPVQAEIAIAGSWASLLLHLATQAKKNSPQRMDEKEEG